MPPYRSKDVESLLNQKDKEIAELKERQSKKKMKPRGAEGDD